MRYLSARTITSRTRSPFLVFCAATVGFLITLFAVPNPAAWAADAPNSQIQIQQRSPAQNIANQRDLTSPGKPLVSPKDDLKTRVGKLIEQLSHPDLDVRSDGAKALGKIGPSAKSAVPALIKALQDKTRKVRFDATQALGKIGQVAIPAVLIALQNKLPIVRAGAADALREIGPSANSAVPDLMNALQDKVPYVRSSAAAALGAIGPTAKSAVPVLIKALQDKDHLVRNSAAWALGRIGPSAKPAVPALITALQDPEWRVRSGAAAALEGIGPEAKDAVPFLKKALQDEDFFVRERAAGALGAIGSAAKDTISVLRKALNDPDERVRDAAKKALEKIQKTSSTGDAIEARNAKLAAEKSRKAQIAADKAEKARIAKEKAEQARLAAEKEKNAKLAAEKERLAQIEKEKAEQAQLEAEKAQKAIDDAKREADLAAKEEEARIAEEAKKALREKIVFFILALVVLGAWVFYWTGRAKKSKGPADILVRDWAIDNLDDDRLGTGDLARSIGRFLRNENTKAPLTLAITGPWGSGKSSIMGMLKDYLDRASFPTIWFNAWHHHEETHLFGALLERLRQGLPAPWTPSGMWFRLRLACVRMIKQPVTLALIGGVAVFTVAFLWQDVVLVWNYSKELAVGKAPSWPSKENWFFWEYATQLEAQIAENTQEEGNSLLDFMLGPLKYPAVFIAVLLAALTRGLGAFTSFGFKPKTLFRKVSKAFNTVSFESDPGLRFKLDEDLGDISTALGKKPLTIFIDDMDRCPPERALKVLESVNFLSSSPRRCFIVLGMWLGQTVNSISGEFADFIEEKDPQRKNESDQDYKSRLHTLRVKHAKSYLDKMIQIEIAVPKIKPEVLANLARNEEDKEKNGPQKKSLRERWEEYRQSDETLKREYFDPPMRFLNKIVVPIILTLVVLASGYLLASISKVEILDSRTEIAQTKLVEIETKIKTSGRDKVPLKYANRTDYRKDLNQSRMELVKTRDQSQDQLALAETRTGTALQGVGLSVGLFGLVFVFVLGGKRNLQDSESYRTALNILAPVMALKERNPRHLKRLVNLLRLISMRDKDKEKKIKTSNAGGNPSSKNEMPELEKRAIKFVLLMALEELEIELIEFIEHIKKAEFQKELHEINSNMFSNDIKIGEQGKEGWLVKRGEASEELVKALKKFFIAFPDVWPSEEDVERYREFLGKVVLREV